MPADVVGEAEFKGVGAMVGIFRQAFPELVGELPGAAQRAMWGIGD
jgi:hypothetical protein